MKIVILASTNGGVLSRLFAVDTFREKIAEVISDRECGALAVAAQFGVPTCILPSSSGKDFSEKLLSYVDLSGTDLFISFYTRLFDAQFLQAAKNKVINLHPSILPAAPGMNGFGDTVKSGSMFIGSTIHFVDGGVDTGRPIIQSAVPFDRSKPIEEMRHAIFNDQCRTLLQVVKWFEEKRIIVGTSGVTVKDAVYEKGIYSPKLDDETARTFTVPFSKNGNASGETAKPQQKSSILDLRNPSGHPAALQYSEIYSNVLLNGKISDGRSQPGFGLGGDTPFVRAAQHGLEFGIWNDGVVEAIQSVFDTYYEFVRPASAAEWLGLQLPDDHILMKSPPWASVFPWRARSVDSYRQAYEKAAIAENSVTGENLDISHGWLFCGPVTQEKSRVEAKRILYVLQQISKNGYQRWDSAEGDVKATALVNGSGEWRWLITAGNHRAAAAAAMRFESIPVRVNLVIHRDHARYWPHVADGLYTEKEAVQVFDNFFDSVTPPVIDGWLDNIRNSHNTLVLQ
ncbi:MAG: phosphoribosylglycinamide formyltransferase [Bacteroidota bacterium]